ncbi:tetratricopeptide repeat protein [bacterium]|nr:MAG: tetratricopeptide repeat protein [bacterium]
MSPRPLLLLPLFGLAGCATNSDTSTEIAAPASVPAASLPRQRHRAEVQAAFKAELLRPAPDVSELAEIGTTQFVAPPAESYEANYLKSLNDTLPKRGLVICEPQGTKAKSFGAGCSRWMDAMGAGSPVFEVVPTWGMAGNFLHSKGWSDLAVGRARAVEVARGLDASHVAIGSFDGQKLQYEVVDVQKIPSKVVGSFKITGSPAQIVAQLPGLTRQLVNATGVKGAQIPASVGMSATDLTVLGSLPRDLRQLQQLKAPQLAQITRLADKPLGAVFVGRAGIEPKPVRLRAVRALLAVAPTNAQLAAEAARNFVDIEKERRTKVLTDLDHKYPRNESVALGNAALRDEEGDYFAQVHYAEMAVRTAPHAPAAWYVLAEALSSQADERRRGATWMDMSGQEKIFVGQIYPRAQVAAWKAVNLDPTDPEYWLKLSSTSTMNSNPEWARDALAESLKRDPKNEDALNWGLEIFQPKWFGDANSFATMARLAVANAGAGYLSIGALDEGLKATGQENLKRPLLQKLIAKEPDNASALREFSYATRMELGDFKAALPYARRAVKLAPNNTNTLTELADILQHDMGKYEESIQLFQRATKLEPKNPLHWVNMALSYAKWGKKDQARTFAIKGRNLGYTGPHPVWAMVGLGPDGSEIKPTSEPSLGRVAN